MPSSKEYLMFVLDQLSGLNGVSCRGMMGEYILYFHGRIVGGIYDDRLLVKPTPAALALMPDAPRESPYPGAKEMILVEDVDNGDFLRTLFPAMLEDAGGVRPGRGRGKTR
jgi:TfoX/Sxy family transcriptional regulator of competence genes